MGVNSNSVKPRALNSNVKDMAANKGNHRMLYDNVQLVSDDITAKALAEFSQREGEEFWPLLSNIFDGIRQGLIVADRRGRIVVFNQTAQKIMGYAASDVVGHCLLWDFCENCDKPPVFQQSLLQGRDFPAEEVEMYAKNSNLALGVRVTPLYTQAGELQGAWATIRDLDAWRAEERQQRSLVKMASIGRIISAVAHEINNPLQTVRTSLELGLDPRKNSAKRKEYLHTADQEINRIAKIIGQMRNFYRTNLVEKTSTDVNQTLGDALSLLQKPFQQAQVEITLALQPDLPLVWAIDYQLEQVFLNLLLNALEAMPHGGKLEVESRLAAENLVAVIFTDNAEASASLKIDQLFDPFAGNRSGGLGLGLSVSQEIIAELGGHIEARLCEKTDCGHILTVYLPCQAQYH